MYSVQSYWDKYRKQNMSAKQRLHKCSLMIENKRVAKCIAHMHITTELKAEWYYYEGQWKLSLLPLHQYICVCVSVSELIC